jgi:hypothetical protein
MSTARDLLENYTGAGSGDNEVHIVINRDRSVTVPESIRKIGVQYDHNVETLTFDCPRYWDKIDLSELPIYVNYLRSDGVPGSYQVPSEEVTVDVNDETLMHFTWKVSKGVTMAAGRVIFLACAKKVDENGDEAVHWNSDPCEDTYVGDGLEPIEVAQELYPDVISKILLKIQAVEDNFDMESVAELKAAANGLIEGTVAAGKATADGDGNTISETYAKNEEVAKQYATKEEVSTGNEQLQETISKITEGETVVGKATADSTGREIHSTYATKEELSATGSAQLQEAITKIQDGTTEVGKAINATNAEVASKIKCYEHGDEHEVTFCTRAEYDSWEASGVRKDSCVYIITDDTTTDTLAATVNGIMDGSKVVPKATTADQLTNLYLHTASMYFIGTDNVNTGKTIVATVNVSFISTDHEPKDTGWYFSHFWGRNKKFRLPVSFITYDDSGYASGARFYNGYECGYYYDSTSQLPYIKANRGEKSVLTELGIAASSPDEETVFINNYKYIIETPLEF